MKKLNKPVLVVLLAGLLFLFGCGGEEYTYVPGNEIKPGPGLFSGEDGEFTLLDTSVKKKEHAATEASGTED